MSFRPSAWNEVAELRGALHGTSRSQASSVNGRYRKTVRLAILEDDDADHLLQSRVAS